MRPNIMLLVGEDTGRHHGCYGHACARTPNIDRLASEGCRYTNAFSTAPVCAPSRSAQVMGKTAFSQGSHHMRSTLLRPPKLYPEALREAGYYVNWTNKTDFNFEPPDSLADDRGEWFEDLAEGRLPDKPWFLFYNCTLTHESAMWKEKWLEQTEPQLKAGEFCNPDDVRVPDYLPDTPEVRMDIARYFDALQLQDRVFGQALDALDQSGQRDNTIVVYLSDHGRGLPREKRWCYDAGIHLPLIVRAPGITEPGTISEELVSWLDLAPTFLSLAGADPLPGAQGRIFLGPDREPEPEFVFAGRDRMDEVFDRVRVARSKRYHYIRNDFPQIPYAARIGYMEEQKTTQVLREMHADGKLTPAQSAWLAEQKPAEELYDAEKDPDNVHNLAGDPAHADILADHRKALEEFLEKTGDMALKSERQLIEEGIVADRLQEYDERREALPERHRVGSEIAPLEMPHSAP